MRRSIVEIVADLDRVAEISKSEIRSLLGELESLKAQLWCRLMEPHGLLEQAERQEPSRLLTVDEAAQKLAFKPAYLYELIRQGIFPAIRQGKYIRVRATDLEDWVLQRRENAANKHRTPVPHNRK